MSRHRPEWTRTIRFRLTVTYSLLLFGLAALVVGGIYLGLSRSLDAQPAARTFDVQKQYRGITVERFTAAEVSVVERVVNYTTLRTLRLYSVGTLGGLPGRRRRRGERGVPAAGRRPAPAAPTGLNR